LKILREKVDVTTLVEHKGEKYERLTTYIAGDKDHSVTWYEKIGQSWFDIKDVRAEELEKVYLKLITYGKKV